MAKCYCKHCGIAMSTVQALVANSCPKSPTKKHVLYEGSEKPKYTCKHCGITMSSIQALTANTCQRSPTKRHEAAL